MPILYQSNYEKHYRAPWFSCSSFSTFLIYLVAVIGPFIFVYYTNGKSYCSRRSNHEYRPVEKVI